MFQISTIKVIFPFSPQKLYQDAWNKDKTNITIPSDTPVMLQAHINAQQISNVSGINMKCKCLYRTIYVSSWGVVLWINYLRDMYSFQC